MKSSGRASEADLLSYLGDELRLVRAAFDMGAASIGGALSPAELRLASRTNASAKTPSAFLRDLKQAIECGRDPLGAVFCALRSPLERRASGSFYTPATLVEPMLRWVLDRKPTRLVDPCCGSGRFTRSALLFNPKLETIAIGVDPVATIMTRAMLSVLKAKRSLVVNVDYTLCHLDRHSGRTAFVGVLRRLQ
jgi:adenine-specific DNA-methyltransferase